MNTRTSRTLRNLTLGTLLCVPLTSLHATDLSVGADYLLRSVSTTERDKSIKGQDYFDQQLQAYLTTDLSKDVEASVRVQSITPWGLEGSTTTEHTTRYPSANGNLWVQNAYVRLPAIWKNRIALTFGRQPIQWGEGSILSDDDLGFNAIRAQIKSPFRAMDFDIDAFTAKITEGLRTPGDTDLSGVMLGFQHKFIRWELVGLFEHSNAPQPYEMGADTNPVTTTRLQRTIYGIRAKTNLKDAFLRGEVYAQQGDVTRAPAASDIKLGGMAYNLGIGGKSDVRVLGRFGALLEFEEADGDNPSTPGKDEAFRPTFASRWSGLERKGAGKYFAAGFNDAYSPSNPFAQASSVNDGLPDGASGIQTIHFGLDVTPWAAWTFFVDYYQYKVAKNIIGPKDLGTEYDYALEYRYTGLVTFKGSLASFRPGGAFTNTATNQNGTQTSAEVQVHF